MPDSSRFVITGLETIQTQEGEIVNQNTVIINQFRSIVFRQFNMQAVNYNIPAHYLSGFIDKDAIIRHIQINFASFPARYLVISRSQTFLNRGLPESNVPPRVSASSYFILFDIVTGDIIQSDTIQTSAAFFLNNLEDNTIIDRSRMALQRLTDQRTQPNLENIIKSVNLYSAANL
jgi:hypothetical protein